MKKIGISFLVFVIGFSLSYLCLSKENSSSIITYAKSPVIMLDAGHGDYDCGSIAQDGTYEKDINLELAMQIGQYLEEAGYQVVYTRTSDDISWPADNQEDLQARIDLAVEAQADYFISIHINSSEYNDGARGFETYVDFEDETMVSMANSIHEQLSLLNYSLDRGLYDSNENPLYVLINNPIPALLLEVGFISDDQDVWYLENQASLLAKAIEQGITNSLMENADRQ